MAGIKQLVKDAIKRALRSRPVQRAARVVIEVPLREELEAFAEAPPDIDVGRLEDSLYRTTNVGALLYPHEREHGGYIVVRGGRASGDPLPMPPYRLRLSYGYKEKEQRWDDQVYLASGRNEIEVMLRVLNDDGFEFSEGCRVLDFGSGAGRLLRWLEPWAGRAEMWGVDISADAIDWAQEHLTPPFHFATTTTSPHLPFADDYFDLVYAGSVFTHIGELADAWFLEIRRVLTPGGRAYVTVFDDLSLKLVLDESKYPGNLASKYLREFDERSHALSKDYGKVVFMATPRRTRVIYRTAYLRDKLARWYEIARIEPEAYGWQTAFLIRKRS